MTWDVTRVGPGASPQTEASTAPTRNGNARPDGASLRPSVAPAKDEASDAPVFDIKMLGDAVEQTNKTLDALAASHRALRFEMDEGSGTVIVKVVDSLSDEVVRQVPSEELLAVVESIKELRALVLDHVG